MSAPAASLTQPSTPPPPRLLQCEAARRHGLYARLHLVNADETQALRAEIRDLFESMYPRGPLAVSQLAIASFQLRRAFGLDPEFLARNPRDITTLLRQALAIGTFDSRYSRLFYDALAHLENLDNQTAERIALKKISGKRTPELIDNKQNAPVRNSGGAALQVPGSLARLAPSPPARLTIFDVQLRSDIPGSPRRRTHLLFQPRAPFEAQKFSRFC